MKCPKCNQRVNSFYIRKGSKGVFTKVGFYCECCKKIVGG